MKKTPIRRAVETSIITAFTIATAFIWRDVIIDFIRTIVPPSETIFYEFLTAIVATIILAVAIYFILKAESEAAYVIKRIRKK